MTTRLERLREAMPGHGVDAVLLSLGRDLPYVTGYQATPLERLTMFVLTSDTATLVVPRLEAPRVAPRDDLEIRPWDETEDPTAIVAGLLPDARDVAIGAQTWARFLLALQAHMPGARFRDATPVTRELRIRKDADEIDLLATAGAAVDAIAREMRAWSFAGRTEHDVARDLAGALRREHDTADFTIVASGPNAASPHHEPGDRVIRPGDSIVIDFGGTRRGYCSDTTRTFFVGEPHARFLDMYAVLAEAQDAAVATVAPGVPAEEVDRAARTIIAKAGYGDFFVHRTGHGIGMETHEEPYIVTGNAAPLEAGNAFSVEPGIYLPSECGARIEDIVVVTADGCRRLNESPRDLAIVG